jgi:hypothetical protein
MTGYRDRQRSGYDLVEVRGDRAEVDDETQLPAEPACQVTLDGARAPRPLRQREPNQTWELESKWLKTRIANEDRRSRSGRCRIGRRAAARHGSRGEADRNCTPSNHGCLCYFVQVGATAQQLVAISGLKQLSLVGQ